MGVVLIGWKTFASLVYVISLRGYDDPKTSVHNMISCIGNMVSSSWEWAETAKGVGYLNLVWSFCVDNKAMGMPSVPSEKDYDGLEQISALLFNYSAPSP